MTPSSLSSSPGHPGSLPRPALQAEHSPTHLTQVPAQHETPWVLPQLLRGELWGKTLCVGLVPQQHLQGTTHHRQLAEGLGQAGLVQVGCKPVASQLEWVKVNCKPVVSPSWTGAGGLQTSGVLLELVQLTANQ